VRPPPSDELLFEVHRGPHRFSCALRDCGARGVEAHISHDGAVLIAHRFASRALAVRWAEQERREIERDASG